MLQKVYIVKVQGWGDDEDAFENVGAFSTLAKAEAHVVELVAQAEEDGLTDVETDIEVMLIDL
jgi:hypothetical protein